MSLQTDPIELEQYVDENLNTVLSLRLAEYFLQTGDTERAKISLNDLLEKNPEVALAHFMLGEIFYGEKNAEAAKERYKTAIALDQSYLSAYRQLARIAGQQGDNDGAASIRKVLQAVYPLEGLAPGTVYSLEREADIVNMAAEDIVRKFGDEPIKVTEISEITVSDETAVAEGEESVEYIFHASETRVAYHFDEEGQRQDKERQRDHETHDPGDDS